MITNKYIKYIVKYMSLNIGTILTIFIIICIRCIKKKKIPRSLN